MADNKDWADGSVSNFDATKFEEQYGQVGDTWYADRSDAYANQRQMFISFQHVPSNSAVSFKAFITAFNESYISDWTSETVYGRADPIYMFKNTTRKITLAFKIPAAAEGEAFENLGRVQKLIQFLYPNYTTLINPLTNQPDTFAQTISQSPLVRLKIMNLLSMNNNDGMPYESVKARDGWANTPSQGLLGVIENVAVNHNLEGDEGAFEVGAATLLPKMIDINLSFGVIHEHAVGWQNEGVDDAGVEGSTEPQFSQPSFPYAVDVPGSLPKPDTDDSNTTNEPTPDPDEQEEAALNPEGTPAPEEDNPGEDAAAAEADAQFSQVLGVEVHIAVGQNEVSGLTVVTTAGGPGSGPSTAGESQYLGTLTTKK